MPDVVEYDVRASAADTARPAFYPMGCAARRIQHRRRSTLQYSGKAYTTRLVSIGCTPRALSTSCTHIVKAPMPPSAGCGTSAPLCGLYSSPGPSFWSISSLGNRSMAVESETSSQPHPLDLAASELPYHSAFVFSHLPRPGLACITSSSCTCLLVTLRRWSIMMIPSSKR
jgi:hypothetical protein